MKRLYIVIPCYNEQEVILETACQIEAKMTALMGVKISTDSRVVFVDDGSKDKTWKLIETLHNRNTLFAGIKLSRNRGHQNALLAGLLTTCKQADMIISMDADLQDDINAIDLFVDEYYKGNDIVYGVRSSRKKDSFFKRNTALMFYRFMKLLGAEVVYNHADYRLMSRRAVEGLSEFKEVNLFLRGIVQMVGYKSSIVEYERNERFAGESKYPITKMLSFALNGITSFSIKPIRMITLLGMLIFLSSFGFLAYGIISSIIGSTVPGWTSLICSIWMIGGIQLLSLGVIGEYIGRIYEETKQRPKYIIEEYLK